MVEFLPYLQEWEKSVKKHKGDYSVKDRNMMLISKETRLGMKVTGMHIMLGCILFIST